MSPSSRRKSLSAKQAAARLGVRVETIYAYVSRGTLSRTLASDGRSSRFAAAEVEALARRGRPRRNARRIGTVDVSMASSLTRVTPDGRFEIRGESVAALSGSHRFEQIAELLWTGTLPARARWSAEPDPRALRVARALPSSAPPVERMVIVATAMAALRPQTVGASDADVHASARALISTCVDALPFVAGRGTKSESRSSKSRSIAARLWPRLSSLDTTRARTRALDTALLLLADHELATSTLATRVAGSTRADPLMAVVAGLATVSGSLHGRAPAASQRLLETISSAADPTAALESLAEDSEEMHLGFGHPVYEVEDPRAAVLLHRVLAIAKEPERRLIEHVRSVCEDASTRAMNVDFALGALGFVARMPPSATEAIFAIARIAGWVAHVLEEYAEAPLRFRAQAIYHDED